MRDAYHDELDSIVASLVDLSEMVATAMARATRALLDADLTLAESVIEGDGAVDAVYHATEERSLDLLARQQPVAGDLRTIVTGLRVVAELERMGDLAGSIAKVARRRYPGQAVPPQARATIERMSEVAQHIVEKARRVLAERDLALAAELERDDDVMDDLHRQLFEVLLDPVFHLTVEEVVDVTLAGRYLERFADHAVSIAHRMVFLVTGERASPVG